LKPHDTCSTCFDIHDEDLEEITAQKFAMVMPNHGLIEWVASQHRGQLIKQTDEPYLNHLLRVAEMVADYAELGFECGLCHDLFEKTSATPPLLRYRLLQCGYILREAELIVSVTTELTNAYSKTQYPLLKKTTRKQKEDQRLIAASATAQTVKYADLFDNAQWMLHHQGAKAPEYLKRKKDLITQMTSGNPDLRAFVLNFIATKIF
jgi:(p)ppGpp synthase/HD superfamily hydrolase